MIHWLNKKCCVWKQSLKCVSFLNLVNRYTISAKTTLCHNCFRVSLFQRAAFWRTLSTLQSCPLFFVSRYRGKTASFAPHVQFRGGSDSESEVEETCTDYDEQVITINPEDEQQMNQFMSTNPAERRTLADIIQEKLTEKRTEIQSQMSGGCIYG